MVFCCFGLLGTIELNLKFWTFIFHKLSRQSPPLQVVNGEWMTSSTVTKSPKSESETRKGKVGYYSPLSKRVETKMTLKTFLDPPFNFDLDFTIKGFLFQSSAIPSKKYGLSRYLLYFMFYTSIIHMLQSFWHFNMPQLYRQLWIITCIDHTLNMEMVFNLMSKVNNATLNH